MTVPVLETAARNAGRTALIDEAGQATFGELLERSARGAGVLLERCPAVAGERVALLAPGSIDYVVGQWSIWRAGACCVPLCVSHPAPELAYSLDEAAVCAVVVHPDLALQIEPLARERSLPLMLTTELSSGAVPETLPSVALDDPALILFTSGTTGKPKGVFTTQRILAAQIDAVVRAWEITPNDRIVHALPLHHLHGILNALCAVLSAGASCELLPRFDAARVARSLAHDDTITLFMGVPTMYARLASHWDTLAAGERAAFTAGCKRMRLLVSGSAALPVAMLDRFRTISGHTLLERYGMSELGMALGQPLHGERRAGSVGVPFPNVEVRLVDEHGASAKDGEPGEIQVRGPNVFREYFRRPEATRAAFTSDGFFRTGDIAVREEGMYRILGRESVDILKTGGFKVSALEIEDVLRTHEAIVDCAVVGVPDEEWGQRVAAAVELREATSLDSVTLREWGKQRLAPYKVPTLLHVAVALPRNALGKVQKQDVLKLFQKPE
jgi:malonyl-CoA/methylmalonyl-CoA synthetase